MSLPQPVRLHLFFAENSNNLPPPAPRRSRQLGWGGHATRKTLTQTTTRGLTSVPARHERPVSVSTEAKKPRQFPLAHNSGPFRGGWREPVAGDRAVISSLQQAATTTTATTATITAS
ncbi:hypothetical protein E2C01_083097 [Portunus trituberculatus]|uniref:Uncharacterized protein n=1 Tax=Portunus trituberculatus TaxID=210409 RepID=A0A5B7IU07_PORTR|nr:hypothetical protein [Portunus trituberculatus]